MVATRSKAREGSYPEIEEVSLAKRATVGRSSLAKGDKRPPGLCAEIISFLFGSTF